MEEDKFMDIKDFIEKFGNELSDSDKTTVTEKTVYKQLESWDSMSALLIMGMIDSDYGVQLDTEDLKNTETLQDLYNRVLQKKAEA